jgi:diacylglycerol kinase
MPPVKSPNLIASFENAFTGLWYALRTQRNARIHLLASLLVFAAGIWLGLDWQRWCFLILAVTLVWMAELSNTAIESVVDLLSPEYHPLAKSAKDVKAGVVVVATLGAIGIGILVLGPPLLSRIQMLLP